MNPVFSKLALLAILLPSPARAGDEAMERLAHSSPSLLVDLGVGLWAWPLPMDYNGDGMMDLVVVCTDKPYNGTWYFENSGEVDKQNKLPIFKPAVRLGDAAPSPTISYVTGEAVVTSSATTRSGEEVPYQFAGKAYPDFKRTLFEKAKKFNAPETILTEPGRIRQNQWSLVDFDGDGALDLTVGVGYWGDYGWDNAFDAQGNWTRGPLHGYVYLLRNTDTTAAPVYAPPVKIEAGGAPVDPFGMPSPSWGDFDGDGDLDLLCGEFLDGFTYFQNTGTRKAPKYAPGRRLESGGVRVKMDLCMITPVTVDFDGDGDLDLVVGDEDGRVALIEHTGIVVQGMPQFLQPRYFQQYAGDVKFGALATPYAFDWDDDGRDDLITGNSAGYIGYIRNLGGTPTRWAAPVYLMADGKLIREQAGPNGSIQGPAEAKWGYSILSVADWDQDGLPDIVTNGIWGRIVWYKNIGTRKAPRLAAAQALQVAPGKTSAKPAWNWWNPQGREFVTQWRTTPQVIDWDGDKLNDLVMLDHEGYLALFRRSRAADGTLILGAGERVFWGDGPSVFDSNGEPVGMEPGLLRLNNREAGGSGRRTFCVADWDGDGTLDLLVNSKPNTNFLRGIGRDTEGRWKFRDEGPVSTHVIAGHATKPTMLDLNADGLQDLLIGAEDGFFYQVPNPRTKR